MARRPSSIEYEAARAMLAMAGIRILKQANVTVTLGEADTYTVTEAGTRRVVCVHLGTGNGDIRIAHNATPTANSLPLIPASYFSVDAEKDDTIQFFNTTAGDIKVYLAEID